MFPYFFVEGLFLFDRMFAIDFQFALRTLEILGRFIHSQLKLYASHNHRMQILTVACKAVACNPIANENLNQTNLIITLGEANKST